MTLDEAYRTLGLRDPSPYGREFAEALNGASGAHPRDTSPSIEAMAGAIRAKMEDSGLFTADFINTHVTCFEYSAKARHFDIYMAHLVHEGAEA